MYRCALAAVTLASVFATAPASAQSPRPFPPNTLRGTMVFGDIPSVTLNGRPAQLSPGSRVRGADNMAVLPPAIAGSKLMVHYTLDVGDTRVKDVWVLTPDEAAIKPWPTTLEEARTWAWNPTTRTWTKP